MFTATVFAILVSMMFALIRAYAGPTIYDRILAVNMVGTKTVLLIAVLGYMMGRPDFLDIAIVYALINFISILAILRFFEYTQPGKSSIDTLSELLKSSETSKGEEQ